MRNLELDVFFQDTFRLARSMVIKIDEIAQRDNNLLIASGYPVSTDKTTWRYYMHLNGDYHPTDDQMTVLSIDTGAEIVFNKANMALHLATFREYNSGGDLYDRLMNQYPHQSELIRGILAPIPYSVTLEAEDYKILNYNKNLVLWNEDQLIPQLQQFIYAQVNQTFKHEYIVTDDLFLPIVVMQLYADIIKEIQAIRLEAVGTRHVHDFYIWSRIDSYGKFSPYKASLSQKQVLWLYRNIAWLKNNPGQQYTFNLLMNNLLTESAIPLAKYDMVETTEDQVDNLTPTPMYRRMQLNLHDEYGATPTFIDTEALIYKEQPLAKENKNNVDFHYYEALENGQFSLHSELPTKVLESAMQDYTNRHLTTRMSQVYNEWIYLAGKGIYIGQVLVTDPKNGRQYRLAVGDAYHLWRHLLNTADGNDNPYIGVVEYSGVMKLTPPSMASLINIGGPKFISQELANGIRNLWVGVTTFVAPERLIEYSNKVYDVQWDHKKQYSQFYDLNKRARVRNAVMYMYESGYVTLGTYTLYKDLTDNFEMDFTEYTPEELRSFAWSIFKTITGWDSAVNQTLRATQSDLIEIMSQLSSYTVQFVQEMNDGTNQTELVNETFIGDSRWTGPGHQLTADLSGVKLDNQGYVQYDGGMEASFKMTDTTAIRLYASYGTQVRFNHTDILKPVNPHELRQYTVKGIDNSYLRLVPENNA